MNFIFIKVCPTKSLEKTYAAESGKEFHSKKLVQNRKVKNAIGTKTTNLSFRNFGLPSLLEKVLFRRKVSSLDGVT